LPSKDGSVRLSRRALLAGAATAAAAVALGGWRLTSAPRAVDGGAGGQEAAALAERLRDVSLADAWLAPPEGDAERRAAWSYRARFATGASEVLLVVGAAGRYELRVGGRPVARGPGPFTHAEAVGDAIDLSAVLADLEGAEGDEVDLEVVVVDPAMETPRSERPWDDDREPLPGGHALVVGVADGSPWRPLDGWRVAPNSEWDLTTPRINHVQPWVEHRREPDRPGGDGEVPVEPGPGPYPATAAVRRQAALAPWAPGSTAQRRHPVAVLRAGTAPASAPGVDDLFAALRDTPVEGEPAMADGLVGGEAWEVAAEGADVHVLVDLGQVWFGTPYAEVDAAPGATVDVAASEALDDDDRLLADDVDGGRAGSGAGSRTARATCTSPSGAGAPR
jgi:hypothetical protein